MKFVLCSVMAAGMCSAANAGLIEFNGQSYETVDWNTSSMFSNVATGTVGGIGLTFETVDISSTTIAENDFSNDSAFDALNFSGGDVESIAMRGGAAGQTTLTFDQAVGSVLILIGLPNDGSFANQFGAAIWDFEDGLAISVIDSEGNPGLNLDAGNQLTNPSGTGSGPHQSGVLGVLGSLSSLSWMQSTRQGYDNMQITFAVAPATVPTPAAGLVLLLPAAMAGRRRR